MYFSSILYLVLSTLWRDRVLAGLFSRQNLSKSLNVPLLGQALFSAYGHNAFPCAGDARWAWGSFHLRKDAFIPLIPFEILVGAKRGVMGKDSYFVLFRIFSTKNSAQHGKCLQIVEQTNNTHLHSYCYTPI